MSGDGGRDGPSACAVVVPAHNEAGHLAATLSSIGTAALHHDLAGVTVLTVVVADDCTDGTAAAARGFGALVVEVSRRNVGAARAAGVAEALDRLRAHGDGVWIVTTDADTLVPPHWLAHHLRHARAGWECLAGTVRLAPHAELSPATVARHDARYFDGRPAVPALWSHPHVHGANLGIAAAAYRRAGGFPPLPYSEDRALVAALERDGRRILRTDLCPVLTSGRPDARAPHGFGAHLRALAVTDN
ncbi:glycosyltransferase [Streptomyces sp. NPDC088261]|uniref:glycosyltransferase n=1 Tax=Streptomyces sp. NPDC088261 TaxID=3365851 RepID=UPI00380FA318